MNDYDKERREWYLSHDICPHCGQNDLQKGYKLCLQCRMNDNERHKNKPISADTKWYRIDYTKRISAERKAAGICVRCGKRKTDGEHINCAICRAKKTEKQREYRRKQGMMPIELRGEGYCSRCYKPIESGKLCAECYEYLVQQAAHMRSRQDNSEHKWRADIRKRRQTNGEPPKINLNAQGGINYYMRK